MISEEYRKGYPIPGIEYQKYGVVFKELWTKYNSRVRIVPGVDASTGAVLKQNVMRDAYSEDADPRDYLSNTFYQCRCMTNFGDRRSSLIVDLAPGSDDRAKYSVSPLMFFQQTVSAAVKNSKRTKYKVLPCWSTWMDASAGQATLPYPKVTLLFQALAFEVNGRPFSDEDKNPLKDANGNPLPIYCLIGVTQTASWMALVRALVDPSDPSKPLDAQTNNKYGAFAEAEGNMLYFNSVPQPQPDKRGICRPYLRPSVQPPGGRGWKLEPYNIPETLCKALWVPWEKLLHYYTAKEQLELIAVEFGADTVNYLFSDNPLFAGIEIPDNIRAAGLGRYAGAPAVSDTASRPQGAVVVSSAGAALPSAMSVREASAPAEEPAWQPASHGVNAEAADVQNIKGTQPDQLLQSVNVEAVDLKKVQEQLAKFKAAQIDSASKKGKDAVSALADALLEDGSEQ